MDEATLYQAVELHKEINSIKNAIKAIPQMTVAELKEKLPQDTWNQIKQLVLNDINTKLSQKETELGNL